MSPRQYVWVWLTVVLTAWGVGVSWVAGGAVARHIRGVDQLTAAVAVYGGILVIGYLAANVLRWRFDTS